MNKPRALDLFCGAGGATMGLMRADLDVVGVDSQPQAGQAVSSDVRVRRCAQTACRAEGLRLYMGKPTVPALFSCHTWQRNRPYDANHPDLDCRYSVTC